MNIADYNHIVQRAMERGANQRKQELWLAGALLLMDPPRRVLEIGTASGGTFWLWKQLATEDAEVMTVDISHHDIHEHNREPRGTQRELWYLGDSLNGETASAAQGFFTGPVDFLFLDAMHDYKSIESDFYKYGQFVRSGGWIAFHDITTEEEDGGGGVPLLWEIVKGQYAEHVEFDLEPEHGPNMGIGMVRLP